MIPASLADFAYLRGVNTQGGGGSQEDPARVPGVAETDYHWNSPGFYQYLHDRGHRVVRIDFLWERVQQTLGAPLNVRGLEELRATVRNAERAGLRVILDMKNYGRYWAANDTQLLLGGGIDSRMFADVWQRLAIAFADEPAVVGFGLMNEPWGLPQSTGGRSTWKQMSQAAVTAIRSAGDTRSILVAGDEWGGAWGWSQTNGPPWIADPADNIYYEAHIYFDSDTSGRYAESYASVEQDARTRGWPTLEARIRQEVSNYLSWLTQYGQRGFIGEIGWPSGTEAAQWNHIGAAVYTMLDDAQVGATYWATGEWLSTDGGMYALDAYNQDRREPQTQTLVIEAQAHTSRSFNGNECGAR